jgi:hypothetical protein
MVLVYNIAIGGNVYYTPTCQGDQDYKCCCDDDDDDEPYCYDRIEEDTLVKNMPAYWFRKHSYLIYDRDNNCPELFEGMFCSRPRLSNYYYIKAIVDYVEAENVINSLELPNEMLDIIKNYTKLFIRQEFIQYSIDNDDDKSANIDILDEKILKHFRY